MPPRRKLPTLGERLLSAKTCKLNESASDNVTSSMLCPGREPADKLADILSIKGSSCSNCKAS